MMITSAPESDEPHKDFKTASELFEMMARQHHLDDIGSNNLSESELILLYKNIDLGTELMNSATRVPGVMPSNQHVETVVYEADSESEESTSLEDLYAAFRRDREQSQPRTPSKNSLCHKIGGMQMPLLSEHNLYDNFFKIQDPSKRSAVVNCGDFYAVYPPTLLDYMCSSHNDRDMYMENVILYFQHTIDQLRRICNGDFLTDRAKQKWKESNSDSNKFNDSNLLACNSQPLAGGKFLRLSVWDELLHSEVDMRNLTKILENKIIIEIPRDIWGSYTTYKDKLDESCIDVGLKKPTTDEQNKENTRVNVAIKIDRLDSGHVVSSVKSITILQTTTLPLPEPCPVLALPAPSVDAEDSFGDSAKNAGLTEDSQSLRCEDEFEDEYHANIDEIPEREYVPERELTSETRDSVKIQHEVLVESEDKDDDECESRDEKIKLTQELFNDISINMTSDVQNTFNVANTKKPESLKKIRLKSPYENQSLKSEEKKRKRLLEIREKRGIRKVSSPKFQRHESRDQPKPSNSVTKLSITNKSFYNSIFGNKSKDNIMRKKREIKRHETDIVIPEQSEEEDSIHAHLPYTPEAHIKYIDPSFYLDETDTGVSALPSAGEEFKMQEIMPVVTDNSEEHEVRQEAEGHHVKNVRINAPVSPRVTERKHKSRSSRQHSQFAFKNLKITPEDCRKKIDEIYDLLKKNAEEMSQDEDNEQSIESKAPVESVGPTDSGSSLNHNIQLSEISYNSIASRKSVSTVDSTRMVVPKVVIRAKGEKDKSKPKANVNPKPSAVQTSRTDKLKTFSPSLKSRENNLPQRNKAGMPPGRPEFRTRDKDVSPQSDINSGSGNPRLLNLHHRDRRVNLLKKGGSNSPKWMGDVLEESEDNKKGEVQRFNWSRLDTLAQPRRYYPVTEHSRVRPVSARGRAKSPRGGAGSPRGGASPSQGGGARSPPWAGVRSPPPRGVVRSPPPRGGVRSPPLAPRSKHVVSPPQPFARERLQRGPSYAGDQQLRESARARSERRAALSPPPPSPHADHAGSTANTVRPSTRTLLVARSSGHSLFPFCRTSPVEPTLQSAPTSKSHGPASSSRSPRHLRTPLLPFQNVYPTTSTVIEESGVLGNKLHEYVDTLPTVHDLTCDRISDTVECKKPSKGRHAVRKQTSDTALKQVKEEEEPQTFNPKTSQKFNDAPKDKVESDVVEKFMSEALKIKLVDSGNDLERLEKALYQHVVSTGNKKLKLKNLTLTPRDSLHQVMPAQAGSALGDREHDHNETKSDVLSSCSELSRIYKTLELEMPLRMTTVNLALSHAQNPFERNFEYKTCKETNSNLTRNSLSLTAVVGSPKIDDEKWSVSSYFRQRASVVEIKKEDVIETADKVDCKETCDVTNGEEKTANGAVVSVNHDAFMSSSLDILVKLLGEIQIMTANQIESELLAKTSTNDDVNKLNTSVEQNIPQTIKESVSIDSFYPIRQMDSRGSAYSFLNETNLIFPIRNNKEVAVNFPHKELMDSIVGVQSMFEMPKVCQSTDVHSLLTMDSNFTFLTFKDSERVLTNATYSLNPSGNILELTDAPAIELSAPIEPSEPPKVVEVTEEVSKTVLHNIIAEEKKYVDKYENSEESTEIEVADAKPFSESRKSVRECQKRGQKKTRECVSPELEPKVVYQETVVFDGVKKMKRDILVTVYSILVFTVFAALTVPEFMYQTM